MLNVTVGGASVIGFPKTNVSDVGVIVLEVEDKSFGNDSVLATVAVVVAIFT